MHSDKFLRIIAFVFLLIYVVSCSCYPEEKAIKKDSEIPLGGIPSSSGVPRLAAISPTDEKIALAVGSGVYLLNTGKGSAGEIYHGDSVCDIKFSGNGRFIGLSAGDKTGFYDTVKHNYIRTITKYHGDFVVSIHFSNDSRYFIVSYGYPNPNANNFKKTDEVISVFSTANGNMVFNENCPRDYKINDADIIGRNGKNMLIYCSSNFICYYDMAERKLISKKKISPDPVKVFDVNSAFLNNNRVLFIERKPISNRKKPWYEYFLCVKEINSPTLQKCVKIKGRSIRSLRKDKAGRFVCLYAKSDKKNGDGTLLVFDTENLKQVCSPIFTGKKRISYNAFDIAPSGKFLVYIRDEKLFRYNIPGD